MQNEKKSYETPALAVHGTVEQLTQQGGGHFIDVPIGTPASNINDVTSPSGP
jgi:hypothetical protein